MAFERCSQKICKKAEFRDLIDKLLTDKPSDRLKLIDVKKHPWMIQDENVEDEEIMQKVNATFKKI